ncbi:MAG: anaerobic ribonucleoside-triphosphate reductase activating protein, partial [Clostridia bacterium]|nr:anaerobic ribonucleoside-triphosphate reductase activating protein [Clostridia bacterium]
LMSGKTPFEFRTTVIPELHAAEDFEAIADWIAGDEPYFLQGYKDSEMVYDRRFSQPTAELMEKIRDIVLPRLPNTQIRGVE